MKDTRATIISATVFHKHTDITNPSVTPEDRIMAFEISHQLAYIDLRQSYRLATLGLVISVCLCKMVAEIIVALVSFIQIVYAR